MAKVLVVDEISNLLGYKSYVALLTQEGTNDPVVTVLKNEIGDIAWTRSTRPGDVSGRYFATSDELFKENKTVVFTGSNANLGLFDGFYGFVTNIESQSVIELHTWQTIDDNRIDNILKNTAIEIRIYE